MRYTVLVLLTLAGCSTQQQANVQKAVNTAVVDGQLFCAKATTLGPVVVAVATAAGVPIIATGATSLAVNAACAAIGGIPVSPPANPAAAPVVTAPGVA